MADWDSIRNEYVTSSVSQRELARKYNVSQASINRRCRSEKWDESRDSFRFKVNQKTVEAVSDLQADRITQLMAASQKAATLLGARLDQMAADGKIKTYEIKAITEALKNVRDLYETDESKKDDTEDDGLVEALTLTAEQVCTGEDDSCILPEENNGEEESG